MLTVPLYLKKLLWQIVCNAPVATGLKNKRNKNDIAENIKSNCSLFFHT